DGTAEAHNGRDDHERQKHVHETLHLSDVVGGARDERGGAEAVEFVEREALYPFEHFAAQVAAETGRGARRKKTRADGGGGAGEGDRKHDRAGAQDIWYVAFGDSDVDDVGHEGRQKKLRNRLDENERERPDDQPGIWFEVADELVHCGLLSCGRTGNSPRSICERLMSAMRPTTRSSSSASLSASSPSASPM